MPVFWRSSSGFLAHARLLSNLILVFWRVTCTHWKAIYIMLQIFCMKTPACSKARHPELNVQVLYRLDLQKVIARHYHRRCKGRYWSLFSFQQVPNNHKCCVNFSSAGIRMPESYPAHVQRCTLPPLLEFHCCATTAAWAEHVFNAFHRDAGGCCKLRQLMWQRMKIQSQRTANPTASAEYDCQLSQVAFNAYRWA